MPDGMPSVDFIHAVIDDGQDEVRREYLRPDQAMKRDGALSGFEACRWKRPDQLPAFLEEAKKKTHLARMEQRADYWYWRYYELQVEWVLNVFSAALYTQGYRPLITPTYRGLNKAIEILGRSDARETT